MILLLLLHNTLKLFCDIILRRRRMIYDQSSIVSEKSLRGMTK